MLPVVLGFEEGVVFGLFWKSWSGYRVPVLIAVFC